MVMTWSWSKKLTWRNGVTYSLSSSKRDFQVSSLIVSEETRSSRFSISNRLKTNKSFSWQIITTYNLSFAHLATFSWFDSALSLLKSPISDCIFVCNLSVLSFSAASSNFSCSTSPFCLLLAVSSCLIWAIILKKIVFLKLEHVQTFFVFQVARSACAICLDNTCQRFCIRPFWSSWILLNFALCSSQLRAYRLASWFEPASLK